MDNPGDEYSEDEKSGGELSYIPSGHMCFFTALYGRDNISILVHFWQLFFSSQVFFWATLSFWDMVYFVYGRFCIKKYLYILGQYIKIDHISKTKSRTKKTHELKNHQKFFMKEIVKKKLIFFFIAKWINSWVILFYFKSSQIYMKDA